MPARKKQPEGLHGSSGRGVQFNPREEHGAHFAPEVQNVNKLTLAFMKAVGANQDDKTDNLVVSPYNAMAAISMVSKGAEGKTREEFARTIFGVSAKELDEAADAYAALNEQILAANKGQVELTTANGVWTNKDLVELKQAFADDLKKTFGAEISAEDFGNPATVGKINGWADKNTKGLIKEVLDRLNSDDAAILASALYFKGQWTKKFDKKLTEDKGFTQDGASKPVQTPTMHQDYSGRDGLTFNRGADYDAVALTYGEKNRDEGKNPTMRIVLVRPSDESVAARDWLAAQADGKIPEWLDPHCFAGCSGSVELPHLDIKQRHDLIPPMQDMGVKKAFEMGQPKKPGADFTRMFTEGGDEICINKVQHDIVFKTDEEGSEAAAVTTIGMVRATSIRPPEARMDIRLDRSFVFALQDIESGAVLFMGAVNKPNENMKSAAKAKPAARKRSL
jgi:serine protease inhibitor